jgi:predicted transcriptional regulator
LKQSAVSRKLGISKGSISQYLQGKRATGSGRLNKMNAIKSKIDDLAEGIAKKNGGEKEVRDRFCLICRIAQKRINV